MNNKRWFDYCGISVQAGTRKEAIRLVEEILEYITKRGVKRNAHNNT